MIEPTRVASSLDLIEGEVHSAVVEGRDLIVLKSKAGIAVFDGVCPHQGVALSGGTVEGQKLVCPGHGYAFDVISGARIGGSKPCLHKFDHREHEGEIQVSAADLRSGTKSAGVPAVQSAPVTTRSVTDLPHPKGWPLVGNMFSLETGRLHLQLQAWSRELGSPFRLIMPNGDLVVITDAELCRRILKDRPGGFRRIRAFESLLKELGGHGVFSQEGPTWSRQRRLVTPSLNTRQLTGFYDQMKRILGRLEARWRSAAREVRVLDVQEEMVRFAVDITTNLAFGYDMNTIEGKGGDLQRHLEHVLPLVAERSLAPFPYWRYFRLPKDRQLDRSIVEIKKVIGEFIENGRKKLAGAGPDVRPSTFIESLLLARDDDGATLSDEEVVGNVFTMLLAGEDTTANSLAWAVHFMCDLPNVQARMQTEADEVLRDGTLASIADADRLSYIEAVAHEAMRLKPVAPLIFLEPNQDVELDGLLLPSGTNIILVTHDAAQRDEHFENAASFLPERWVRHQKSAPGHDAEAFIPFGHGPRHCPGRSLALLEMKAVLSMLSRKFEVRKVPAHPPVHEVFGFTMHPTKVQVLLSERA